MYKLTILTNISENKNHPTIEQILDSNVTEGSLLTSDDEYIPVYTFMFDGSLFFFRLDYQDYSSLYVAQVYDYNLTSEQFEFLKIKLL